MKLLAIAVALVIAAVGLIGVVSPSLLIEFVRPLLTPTSLYVVAAVRVAFGLVLWFAAAESRLPRALRAFGGIVLVAGLLTPAFGLERSQSIFNWWAAQPLWFMRAWAVLPVILGCIIIYACRPHGRPAA